MTSVYRHNLHIQALEMATEDAKLYHLVPFLKNRKGPGIIYVTRQQQAEDLCKILRAKDIEEVEYYHAGLSQDERKRIQDQFMASDRAVIIATIAWGMGIDKANVRFIIHYTLPEPEETGTRQIALFMYVFLTFNHSALPILL